MVSLLMYSFDTIRAASSEKGAYGHLKKIVRYMLAFDYYEGYLLILR